MSFSVARVSADHDSTIRLHFGQRAQSSTVESAGLVHVRFSNAPGIRGAPGEGGRALNERLFRPMLCRDGGRGMPLLDGLREKRTPVLLGTPDLSLRSRSWRDGKNPAVSCPEAHSERQTEQGVVSPGFSLRVVWPLPVPPFCCVCFRRRQLQPS